MSSDCSCNCYQMKLDACFLSVIFVLVSNNRKDMVKLVIFDLDGTLLNSLEDLAASTNYALRRARVSGTRVACLPLFRGERDR